MKKFLWMLFKEARLQFKFSMIWSIVALFTTILFITIYPGKAAMQAFVDLLKNPAVQIFFGSLGNAGGFTLWALFSIPFMSILVFIISIILGARGVLYETEKRTSELYYSLPISRTEDYIAKLIVVVFYTIIVSAVTVFPWNFPIVGTTLPSEKVFMLFVDQTLLALVGVGIGMIFGAKEGTVSSAQLWGSMVAILLYGLQLIANSSPSNKSLKDFNPLLWFDASSILLEKKYAAQTLEKFYILIPVLLLLTYYMYLHKDLVKGISRNIIPRRLRFSLHKGERKSSKSGRTSIFTFWARPFEKRYPFFSDFVYSEARGLMVMLFVIIVIFPLQIFAYPGDAASQKLLGGFSSGGIFRVILYGENLVNHPYFGFIALNTYGAHWIYMLPLAIIWGKKIVAREVDAESGDITGSLNISKRSLILQRSFAVLAELLYIIILMVIFLALSEYGLGKTPVLGWEIVALFSMMIFYAFLTFLSATIGFLVPKYGIWLGRLIIIGSLLQFLTSLMSSTSSIPSIPAQGIFGLFNPVLIVLKKSWLVADYGMVWLTLGTILFMITTYLLSDRLEYIKVDETA